MISDCTKSIIKYGYLKGIGRKYLVGVLRACAKDSISVEEYFIKDVVQSNKYSVKEIEEAEKFSEEQVSMALSFGHNIISMNDFSYPDSLRDVPDPPPFLYCSGNIDALKKDSVTVIGTREPTEHGRIIAERVTSWFVSDGWVITSGLAKGVDTVAHNACVEVGGATIAVMAHGLEKVYPAANRRLAERIVEHGGILVSEYGYNSYVNRSNFIERDRIQAALAKGVVLVQSDLQGGSLHASRASLRYDRYLVVLEPSALDIRRKESKVSANILFKSSNDIAKAELLAITPDKLNMVLYLKDKKYLPWAASKLRGVQFQNEDRVGSDLFG